VGDLWAPKNLFGEGLNSWLIWIPQKLEKINKITEYMLNYNFWFFAFSSESFFPQFILGLEIGSQPGLKVLRDLETRVC
jgi:hypothetical protein